MLIDAGKKAPAFTLNDQDGKTHKLSDYTGRPVVLYFYPKDDTPGCTKESCAFRDNLAKFTAKYQLNFPLLADAEHEVAEKYGVWQEKQNYGKSYMGIVRTTYLIDGDGKVAKRWDKVNV